MVSWRWLQPGLHLKRWVLTICAGLVLLILGAMALGLELFGVETPLLSDQAFSLEGVAILLLALGASLIFTGIYRLIRRVEKLLKRQDESRGLAEIAYQQNRLAYGPKLACLGGGTGLSTVLAGLREYSGDITAIVSVADDGGSSGRLRLDFDILPPGDIRNCLISLADAGPVMAELMQYRFAEGELSGHSFGNLFITVLARIRGDFGLAVREANRILSVRGQVLPATLDKVGLVATHPDGTKTTGQRHIARCGKPIAELSLKPQPGESSPDVLEALQTADFILLGPGSLFTSVLPPLLAPDIVTAISAAKAKVIYAVNVMSQPGETGGFTAADHIRALLRHAPGLRLDYAVVNSYRPSPSRLEKLQVEGITLTEYDRAALAELPVRVLPRDVIDIEHPRRHDARKLAAIVSEIWQETSGRG